MEYLGVDRSAMKIAEQTFYNGAESKSKRLGLDPLLDEIQSLLATTPLLVKEERDANGGAAVRRLIDASFESARDWIKTVTGGIDWKKCKEINGTKVCIGVEVQVSGRSDLIAVDLIHLKNAIVNGEIDIGIVVVPSDTLARFLTDRGPNRSETRRHLALANADQIPLAIFAIEHDGPGPPLPKQFKRKAK